MRRKVNDESRASEWRGGWGMVITITSLHCHHNSIMIYSSRGALRLWDILMIVLSATIKQWQLVIRKTLLMMAMMRAGRGLASHPGISLIDPVSWGGVRRSGGKVMLVTIVQWCLPVWRKMRHVIHHHPTKRTWLLMRRVSPGVVQSEMNNAARCWVILLTTARCLGCMREPSPAELSTVLTMGTSYNLQQQSQSLTQPSGFRTKSYLTFCFN